MATTKTNPVMALYMAPATPATGSKGHKQYTNMQGRPNSARARSYALANQLGAGTPVALYCLVWQANMSYMLGPNSKHVTQPGQVRSRETANGWARWLQNQGMATTVSKPVPAAQQAFVQACVAAWATVQQQVGTNYAQVPKVAQAQLAALAKAHPKAMANVPQQLAAAA